MVGGRWKADSCCVSRAGGAEVGFVYLKNTGIEQEEVCMCVCVRHMYFHRLWTG